MVNLFAFVIQCVVSKAYLLHVIFNLNTLTLLTTLLTAVVTIVTVFEIKKQRQSTYKPDLFINSAYVSVYGFDLKNDRYSDFQYERKINREKQWKYVDDPENTLMWLHLELHNIGFGAAKHVKYYWEFDFENFIQLLQSMNDDNFSIERTEDTTGLSVSITHNATSHFSYENYERLFLEKNIDFVNPSNIAKTVYEITVPGSYVNLLSYYIVMKYEMLSLNPKNSLLHDSLAEVPPLFVEFDYEDIGNKKHNKRFKCTFIATNATPGKNPNPIFHPGVIANYSIKVQEI